MFRKFGLLAAAIITMLGVGLQAAHAQGLGGLPNAFRDIDENGVNVVDGTLVYSSPEVSIGGLSYTRQLYRYSYWTGSAWAYTLGWRPGSPASLWVTSDGGSGYIITVSHGERTDSFHDSAGTLSSFAIQTGGDATLSYSSTYSRFTYASGDGTAVVFNSHGDAGSDAIASQVVSPNGYTISYTYKSSSCGGGTCRRLSSINNNRGYQIKIEYANNSTPSNDASSGWQTITKVTAINNAVEYCDPAADTCSLSGAWRSVTFANPSSGVHTATDEQGRVTRYAFNGSGLLTGIRQPGSSTDDVTIAYSGYETVTSITTAPGTAAQQVWTYDRTSSPQRTDPGGGIWKYGFTDTYPYRLITVTDPLGRIARRTHDSNGRTSTVLDTSGVLIQYTYDARGNVTEARTKPAPGTGSVSDIVETASYSSSCSNPVVCNKPNSVTSSGGIITSFTYNATHGGMETSTTNSVVTTTTYAQQTAWYKTGPSTISQATAIYQPVTTSACISGTSCADSGKHKTTLYYQIGNSTVGSNALLYKQMVGAGDGSGPSQTTESTFDAYGRVLTVDGPLSGTDDTVYNIYDDTPNGDGWTSVLTIGPDPDGGGSLPRPAQLTYSDIQGRLVQVDTATVTSTAGAGYTYLDYAKVTYDAGSRPIAQSYYDGGGNPRALTNISYNAAGLVECVAERMNPSTFGTPTAACTATTVGTSGPDRISKTTYDLLGRPIRQASGVGTVKEQHLTTTYDARTGQIATLTDAQNNVTTYEYDRFNRPVKTAYPNPSTAGVSSTSDYSEASYSGIRPTSLRLRDGSTVSLAYDSFGRLSSQTISSVTDSFTYDNLGRQMTVQKAGADTTTFTYNALYLTSVAHPLAGASRTVAYEYDTAGRRTKMTYPGSTPLEVTYVWGVSTLSQIKEGTSTTLATFAYDNRGRRTSVTLANGAVTNYSYDTQRPMLSGLTLGSGSTYLTRTFARNQAGQITTRSSSNAGYDAAAPSAFSTSFASNGLNQLTNAGGNSVSHDGRGNLSSDSVNSYGYDLENRLTSTSGASFTYDPLGRLAKSVGSATTWFLYDDSDLIAEYDNSGTVLRRYVHGPNTDEPLVWYEGSGLSSKSYFQADERGSIIAVTNGSGAVTASQTYDEYGAATSVAVGRFGYTGQAWIPEAGLYYYKARFYSPHLGRFMQPDPIGYGDGPNIYAYVGGDPINRTDPSGLMQTARNCVEGTSEYGEGPCQEEEATLVDEIVSKGTFIRASTPSSGCYGRAGGCVVMGLRSWLPSSNDLYWGEQATGGGAGGTPQAVPPTRALSCSTSGLQSRASTPAEFDDVKGTYRVQTFWRRTGNSLPAGYIIQSVTLFNDQNPNTKTYWEAWKISEGQRTTDQYNSRQIYSSQGAERSYYDDVQISGSHPVGKPGWVGAQTSAIFSPSLPAGFGVGVVPNAPLLIGSLTDPGLDFSAGCKRTTYAKFR